MKYVVVMLSILFACTSFARTTVTGFSCEPKRPDGSSICRINTEGTVEQDDTLVLSNVFGSYRVSSSSATLGDTAILGLKIEANFLPKMFSLRAIAGTNAPVIDVLCSLPLTQLHFPPILSKKTSIVFISDEKYAQTYFFGAIAKQFFLLLLVFATAAIGFAFAVNGTLISQGGSTPNVLWYSCGLLWCLSMTRVPRIFAPALISHDHMYWLHDIIQYIAFWALGEIVISTSEKDVSFPFVSAKLARTPGSENKYRLSNVTIFFATLGLNLGLHALGIYGHGYAVAFQCGSLFLLGLLRLARYRYTYDAQSKINPSSLILVLYLFSALHVAVDDLRQMYDDYAVTIFAHYTLLVSIAISGLLTRLHDRQIRQEREAIIQQVSDRSRIAAHDIRSPLSTILVLSDRIQQMDPHQRQLMQTAVSRIESIAENILTDNAEHGPASAGHLKSPMCAVSEVLLDCIEQKQTEFSHLPNIRIKLLASNAETLAAKIEPPDLARIVSNILNNAIEAMGDSGLIIIALQGTSSHIEIVIDDDGPGISDEIRRRVFHQQVTEGKANGHGLGLFYAHRKLSEVGGKIELPKKEGNGTTVRITLLKAV